MPLALFATPTVVCFDMEWTAWEGSAARNWGDSGEYREIVQIGAVRVRVDDGFAEIDSFQTMVRPRLNPRLSDYFTTLTGLTQERVDREGVDVAVALEKFAAFVGTDEALSNGADELVLKENRALFDLTVDFRAARFIDLRPVFVAATGMPHHALVSGELPETLGFPAAAAAHDALADARAVAGAIRYLRCHERL